MEHLILRKLEHSAHDDISGVAESKKNVGAAYDELVEVLQKQKNQNVFIETVAV